MFDCFVDPILASGSAVGSAVLHLFDGPDVTLNGHPRIPVPMGCHRLVVFMAMHRGQVERRRVAGALWPDDDEQRAAGNLRSSLWRLRRAQMEILDSDQRFVAVRQDVLIDLDMVSDWAAPAHCRSRHRD